MDYSRIIEELKQAPLFDLYRLQVAISHQLENPQRIQEIKSRLKLGQTITYFDGVENRLIEAKVIKLKRTRLLVQNKHDKQRWDIPFYWVNLDSVDTDITLSSKMGVDRSQIKVGDKVGNYKLVDIKQDELTFSDGRDIYKLNIGQGLNSLR